MTPSKLLTGLALLAIGVAAVWLGSRPDPIQLKPDTVYQRVTERSAAVIDTVTKTVTFFKTRIDTMPGDTVFVPKEVIREVIRACELCAEQLRIHKRVSDSIIKVVRDSLAQCQRDKAAAKNERKWWAIGGSALGRLSCGMAR